MLNPKKKGKTKKEYKPPIIIAGKGPEIPKILKEKISSYADRINGDKDEGTWNLKGVMLHKVGDYEKAIECYIKAIELAPGNADIWYNKGLALSKLGETNQAAECFDKAFELDPSKYGDLRERDNNVYHLENREPAIIEFDTSELERKFSTGSIIAESLPDGSTFYPDFNIIQTKDGVSQCKIVFLESENPNEGGTVYLNANIDGGFEKFEVVKALIGNGKYLGNDGNFEEALRCFCDAVELDPDNSNAWLGAGITNYNLENYEDALICFDLVIKLNGINAINKGARGFEAFLCPKNERVQVMKAYTLQNLGREEEAVKSIQVAKVNYAFNRKEQNEETLTNDFYDAISQKNGVLF